MNRAHAYGRILSLCLLSLLVGWQDAHSTHRDASLGRAGYLADQGAYYDRYLSHGDGVGTRIFTGAILIILLLLAYELVSFLFTLVIQRVMPGTAGRSNAA